MAKRKQNETTAGLFVIAALVITLGVVLWLGAADIFKPRGQRAVFYVTEADGNPGLTTGSLVLIGAKEVGRIAEIHFRPDTGRVLFVSEINRRDFEVHADGKAYVSEGLVGGAALVITSRGSSAEPLADESNPVHITGGLDRAMNDLAAAARHLRTVIQAELDAANPAALLSKVHEAADGLRAAATNVAEITANVLPQTDVTNPTAMLARINRTLDSINELAEKLVTDAEGLSELITTMNQTMAKVNAGEGSIGKLLNDPRLYRSLLDTADELNNLLQEARDLLKTWKKDGIPLKLK